MNLSYLALVLALFPCVTAAQAEGDAANGQALYESRCIGCHSTDSNRIGPAHRGVFGRRAGAVPEYDYSDALKESEIVWTEKNLDQWLSNPDALIPGQKMGYSVSEAKDRADLIAYLMSISSGARRSHDDRHAD